MDLLVQILDSAGTLVLDVNDETAGYKARTLPDAQRTWEAQESTSPFVDGSSVGQQHLATVVKQLEVFVRGTTWAQVEQRFETLIDAIEQVSWFVAIGREGTVRTWRATGCADSTSEEPPSAVLNRVRVVTIRFRAQPTAAITYPEEP